MQVNKLQVNKFVKPVYTDEATDINFVKFNLDWGPLDYETGVIFKGQPRFEIRRDSKGLYLDTPIGLWAHASKSKGVVTRISPWKYTKSASELAV